jgi:hypothetical protein
MQEAGKENYFVVKREASDSTNALLSCAQCPEIFRSLRHYISKQLYYQTPFQVTSYAYVHEHPWIRHRSKGKPPPNASSCSPSLLSLAIVQQRSHYAIVCSTS